MVLPSSILIVGLLMQQGSLPSAAAFGKCTWWQGLQANATTTAYRLGFAQGIVLGTMATPPLPVVPRSQAESDLLATYTRGLTALLQKPALMRDAFDRVCGDYRNAEVGLEGVALIATLEIGGLEESRAAAALVMLRADRLPNQGKLLVTLIGGKKN